MAVTGELETAAESEQETTDSDNIRYCCTFCGHNYRRNPNEGCEHLLCKIESLESNFELVEAPDHPVTATLFGIEVPRVVATKFIQHLRQQSRRAGRAGTPSYVRANEQGVVTVDLLAEKRAQPGLVVIKSTLQTPSSFCEHTFYLSARPAEAAPMFSAFVQKQYCGPVADSVVDVDIDMDSDGDMMDLERPSVPFSRVQVYSEVMALDVEDLVPEIYL